MSAQPNIYGHGEWWEDLWRGMPEFDQRDLAPRHSIEVVLRTERDLRDFERAIGQRVPT